MLNLDMDQVKDGLGTVGSALGTGAGAFKRLLLKLFQGRDTPQSPGQMGPHLVPSVNPPVGYPKNDLYDQQMQDAGALPAMAMSQDVPTVGQPRMGVGQAFSNPLQEELMRREKMRAMGQRLDEPDAISSRELN